MAFKLGVIGHKDTLKVVTRLAGEYFDQVQIFAEEFNNDEIIQEAVERIGELQKRCDALLYSRLDPYLLISEHLHHDIPVSYVEVHESHLLISFLTAIVRYNIRPAIISVDSFDRPSTLEALASVGIAQSELTIYPVTHDPRDGDMVNKILGGHLKNRANGAELCITNITGVWRKLTAANIPCVVINPLAESFIREIRNLMLRHKLKGQRTSPLAVSHIRLMYKDKYRFRDKMPIRELDELNNAAKLITISAEKLDGAMYSLSRWEYVVLCDGPLLFNLTEEFSDIDLMQKINLTTAFDVAIGIGFGQSIREAESNAMLASRHTMIQRGTNTVVAMSSDPNGLIGPLHPKSEHFIADSRTDAKLAEIAKKTGISTSVLHKIYQATLTHNSYLFTSAELAKTLDMSSRTANRLIERLLDYNYALIEGKDLSQTKGRPARVIRLLF